MVRRLSAPGAWLPRFLLYQAEGRRGDFVVKIEAWSLVTHPGERVCLAGMLIPA